MCSINSFVMAGLCVAGLPQTDGGRAADSCVLDCKTRWLHERESMTHTEKQRERERESVSEDRISLCLSLHQWGVIWPSVARYICPTCLCILLSTLSVSLSLSLSLSFIFSRLPSIPLSFGPLPDHTPHSAESVCRCVYVRRIISVQDVCQNKGLISFKKNYNLCTRTHTHSVNLLLIFNKSIYFGEK